MSSGFVLFFKKKKVLLSLVCCLVLISALVLQKLTYSKYFRKNFSSFVSRTIFGRTFCFELRRRGLSLSVMRCASVREFYYFRNDSIFNILNKFKYFAIEFQLHFEFCENWTENSPLLFKKSSGLVSLTREILKSRPLINYSYRIIYINRWIFTLILLSI